MGNLYLPSFYIKGFKSIEEMDLNSLSAINLIAGDNNVGKSTILEAMYAFVTNGHPEALLQMAFHRMNIIRERLNTSYEADKGQLILQFFNGWEFRGGKSISLQVSDSKRIDFTLAYAHYEEIQSENGIFQKRTIEFENKSGNETDKGVLIQTDKSETFFSFDGIRRIPREFQVSVPVQFIHTSLLRESINSQLWDGIALTGLEKYIVDALRIIDPNIDNLAFIDDSFVSQRYNTRVPYITFKDKSGRYPLSIMGDGMNRILSIILGLVSAKDGVCLIDEIENGIYYKRQPELWNIICHLVKELNIQLFATTHSLDCIRNFSISATDNAQFIRLEKRKTGIKAVCYQPEELKVALENDIELR